MAPRPVFSLVKYDLRTELCRHEGLVGLPVVLPKVPAALRLVVQTRIRRPHDRCSFRCDVPRHRNGHDPHYWLQGFADRRDADGIVWSGLEAPKTRPTRTPGMRRMARYLADPGSCRPAGWQSSPEVRSRRAQHAGRAAGTWPWRAVHERAHRCAGLSSGGGSFPPQLITGTPGGGWGRGPLGGGRGG